MTSPPQLSPPPPWSAPTPLPGRFETNRLTLRSFQPEDGPGIYHAIEVDRTSFLPWLPWVLTHNRTIAECVTSIEERTAKRAVPDPLADDFVIGIFDGQTGGVLGGTGLHRINLAAYEAEIGYWIRPDRRREGLCAEAVAGLITWAFQAPSAGGWGLRRIHIRCAGSNVSSQHIPSKLGLRMEGRLRHTRWTESFGWDDTLIWGVLAEEWDAKQHTRVDS